MYSRTTTQFDLMMKTIMVVLFMFGLFVFFVDVSKAAEFWVTNPALCPVTSPSFPGQNCTPQNICGDLGGTAQCFTTTGLIPPSVSSTSNVNYTGSYSGGYLINCFATDDGVGARCDNSGNFWCDRNETCYGTNHKETVCTENVWGASSCGNNCVSGYQDCDATPSICEVQTNSTNCSGGANNNIGAACTCQCDSGYVDCDASGAGSGNGCEINVGITTCTGAGGLSGVYDGSCQCVIATSTFVTGIESIFATSSPLLWGRQYGEGDLINFGNATSTNIFVVKNDGTVFMTSTAATSSVPNQFYNYNGDLYWGDTKLNSSGGVYTAGSGLNLNGYEFTVNTSTDFIWSGQHTFNTTTTFPNGIWSSDGKIGIGTTTPQFTLSIKTSIAQDGVAIFDGNDNGVIGFGADQTGSGSFAIFNNGNYAVVLNGNGGYSFIDSGNFGIGTTTPDYKFTLDGDGFFMARGLSSNPIYNPQGDTLTQTGEGTRTFFYPRKAAFRAGGIVDMSVFPEGAFDYLFTNEVDQWDDANIGLGSFAANVNNKASGDGSSAFGVFNTAYGQSAFIGGGVGNIAGNMASIIGGRDNKALNWHSFIGGGYENTALGWASAVVSGKNNTSTGEYSFIGGGEYNEAIGRSSVAFGEQMTVFATNSFGINLFGSGISSTLAQDNTFAVMGGNVGIGTTTPLVKLAIDGEMLVTQTSTMRDVIPERDNEFNLGTTLLRWLTGWFRNLFADEATIVSSTLVNANIGTSTIANAIITSSTLTSTTIVNAEITNLNAVNATFTSQVAFQATSTHNSGIRSNLYCDINGANCFDPSLGWVVPIADVTTTPVTTNGDFSSGTLKGYQAANAICDYNYPGYHFCFSGEIISFIRLNDISKFNGLPQAWIAEGPPGYTAYANDCGGYSTSSVTYLGAFWEYDGTTGGGQGWLVGCNNLRAISCCK